MIKLPEWAKQTDIVVAISVIGVLIVMILPIPPVLLDLFLSFSITISIVIMLVAMYNVEPLEFSVFPSLLLIVTLFRLSLNVASTRLILLRGNEGLEAAGQVINAFGAFVVGGDYVVGAVIFIILVVINFVVITKGAGRIAEVAARFTLDAMPGKQMSIDADLNAGLINETEARARRKKIEAEADFYGAMDGASKFVTGDAIAGIIITLVNILGGFAIGVFKFRMDLAQAAKQYMVMTIGDGLVAQIPALIISTAAGIIVTRAASESNLGKDVSKQLLIQPKALGITAVVLAFFAIIPGLPKIPFFFLATVTGVASYIITNAQKENIIDKKKKEEVQARQAQQEGKEKIEGLLPIDTMEIEVGYNLISMVDAKQGGVLLERIKSIRRQIALDIGLIVPPIRIRDNLQLKPNEYNFILKGTEIAKGELLSDRILAINPGMVSEKIDGIQTKEPAFGLNALWITNAQKEKAQTLGYTVVDAITVIATHLTEIIKSFAAELLTRQDVQNLLKNVTETQPKVVEELVPNVMTVGGVQKILQNLLKERVSIRDLPTILEVLADYATIIKDHDLLTEYVRQGLARSICKQYQNQEGKLSLVTLDPGLDQKIANSLERTDQGSYLALEPNLAKKILKSIEKAVEKVTIRGYQPVILCSPGIRVHLKRFTDRFIPNITILSHNEIPNNIEIEPLGGVSLVNEG
ncbi:MAG: flagellar biosynthesis protein FlhA [bacterium]